LYLNGIFFCLSCNSLLLEKIRSHDTEAAAVPYLNSTRHFQKGLNLCACCVPQVATVMSFTVSGHNTEWHYHTPHCLHVSDICPKSLVDTVLRSTLEATADVSFKDILYHTFYSVRHIFMMLSHLIGQESLSYDWTSFNVGTAINILDSKLW
jgi:hypothetical protein